MNSTRGVPGWSAESHEGTTRTFYQRGGVTVTTWWLVVGGHRYAVAELHRLRMVRGPRNPVVAGTAVVAVAYAAAVVVSQPHLQLMPWLGMVAIGAVPAGLAIGAWRLCPRPFQLWADYRGSTVLVFASADQRVFGHVCRALIRAREHRPPERPDQEAVA